MAIQTNVIATPKVRQGAFITPTFSIPAGILNLKIVANIALADKLTGVNQADGSVTGALTCDLDLQHSVDGATNWQSAVGFGWTSYGPNGYPAGKDGIANPDPSISFSPSGYLGQTFRIVLNIPQPLTVGATVVITT